MFAQIYICPKHGETWHAHQVEDIDTENDEIYPYMIHTDCGLTVHELIVDGKPVWHVLTTDEMAEEMYSDFSDDSEDDEFWDDELDEWDSDTADEWDDLDDVDVTGEMMDIAWDLMDEPTPDQDDLDD